MEHIVFLTGRLAQPQLERVLAGIDDAPFTWEVREIGLQVAALMTADMIRACRAVSAAAGQCNAPTASSCPALPRRLEALTAHYGIPVQRGPEELKDLPRFFNRAARPVDLSEYEVAIFAEIVDAPRLSVEAIVAARASAAARRRQRHRPRLPARNARSTTSRTACAR